VVETKPQGSLLEVNAAVVPRSNAFLPGETPPGQLGGESAEAIVPNSEPGAGIARLNTNTGRLDVGKGRNEQEHFDLVEDSVTAEAGRPGNDECRHAGKHGRFKNKS
jgi:hypothetical protein